MRRAVLALLLGLLFGPSASEAAGPPQRPKFRAVLVAGDGSLAVWDRGIARLRAGLDAALEEGCGEAPTFVVASGCYSGGFAAGPMARRNRAVFAAARRDLPSFGCHADFDVTVFDGCMLYALDSAPANTVVLNARLGDCVEAMEQRLRMQASHPQAWLGTGAPRLVPPFRAPPRS